MSAEKNIGEWGGVSVFVVVIGLINYACIDVLGEC